MIRFWLSHKPFYSRVSHSFIQQLLLLSCWASSRANLRAHCANAYPAHLALRQRALTHTAHTPHLVLYLRALARLVNSAYSALTPSTFLRHNKNNRPRRLRHVASSARSVAPRRRSIKRRHDHQPRPNRRVVIDVRALAMPYMTNSDYDFTIQ